jgi:protein SCO1/2
VLLALAGALRAAHEHAHHHHHADVKPGYTRANADFRLPQVKLTRADGRKVGFPLDIDDGRPVLVNFIFTTCTAICPPMSQIFSEFQKKLGAERDAVRMVSISIDPEQDTPKRLTEYAKKYKAGPQWTFYTGTLEASIAVQKAFAAYRGDKMNHTPVTFMRAAPGKPWVRLDGFTTPDELLKEYRALTGAG